MSKRLKTIYYSAFVLALILHILNDSHAQTVQAKIKITESNATVEGSFIDANRRQNVTNFSFLKSYTNIESLGARISDINLYDKNGQEVNYKKLADGEFLADGAFERWNYRINLSVPKNVSAMAHVSWLSDARGILMLADL